MAEPKIVISEYELRMPFPAPRINLAKNEPMSYKDFAAGDKVRGFILHNQDPMAALPPDMQIIVTEDMKYALPMRVINYVKDVKIDGKPVADKTPAAAASDMTLPQEIQAKLNAIKSSDLLANVIKSSQRSSTGLVFGAAIGGVYGLVKKRSVILWAIIGGVAGGIAGYKISEYKNKPTSAGQPATTPEPKPEQPKP